MFPLKQNSRRRCMNAPWTICATSARRWSALQLLPAFPGWGQVAIGATALLAAVIAAQQSSFKGWLAVWIAEALVSLLIAGWSMDRKARAAQLPLLSGPGRKVAFSLSPPILAGGLLSIVLYPRWLSRFYSGSLAAALWNRRRYRRDVLGSDCPSHGDLLYGAGSGCAVCASVCELVYGSRLWRTSHHFRHHYRKEIRWLNILR